MNQFNCPHCGQTLQDDGSLAGQAVACPICGQMFRMPGGPQPYSAPVASIQPAPVTGTIVVSTTATLTALEHCPRAANRRKTA